MRLYTLYDTIAEEAGPIFEARNDNIARRIYTTMNKDSLPPGATLEDFKLLKLGSFFHGNEKEKPHLYGLSVAYDVTKDNGYYSRKKEEYPEDNVLTDMPDEPEAA